METRETKLPPAFTSSHGGTIDSHKLYELSICEATQKHERVEDKAEVLPFLSSQTSITDTMLYNSIGGCDSGILPQLLTETTKLKYMKVGLGNWVGKDASNFLESFAEGLRGNKSLRLLHLTPGKSGCNNGKHPQDLSTLVAAISEVPTLEELKLNCEFETGSTLVSLSNLLQKPDCQLKSLEVTCYTNCCEDVRLLIQAAKCSPNLEHFDLSLRDPSDTALEALDSNATFDLVVEALKATPVKPRLSHLSIRNNGLEQPLEQHQLDKILQHMNSNSNLEHVKLQMWYRSGDGHFDRQLMFYCTRNKALKMAEDLGSARVNPATICSVLKDVEKDCPNSVDYHLVNIWFSLLVNRPHEIHKYDPLLAGKPAANRKEQDHPSTTHSIHKNPGLSIGVFLVTVVVCRLMGSTDVSL